MGRRPNNPFFQSLIEFNEEFHTYTVKETGQKLTSITTLIHKYQNEFDPQGFAARACAKRDGITVDQIKEKWNSEKVRAGERGTMFHKQAEIFVNTKKIPDGPDKDILKDFKKKFKPEGKIFSEVLVHNIELGICGTADLVIYDKVKNSVYIEDFKTNKQIKFKSFNNQKMLYPLTHILDCNYYHYCIQLSCYLYLLSLQGFNVRADKLKLYWINPETRLIEIIPVPYMKKEVESMIDHFINGIF